MKNISTYGAGTSGRRFLIGSAIVDVFSLLFLLLFFSLSYTTAMNENWWGVERITVWYKKRM